MTFLRPDISFRVHGGGIPEKPELTSRFLLERTCRIILIHGLQNSQSAAIETYERFQAAFSGYGGYLAHKLFYLVWPGDEFGLTGYFDKNSKNAFDSGAHLAECLDTLLRNEDSQCEFVIIAHSLGCRLTASMMAELQKINAPLCHRFKLFLMAGAVPQDEVSDVTIFQKGMAASGFTANLYSPDDNVLGYLFPLGELGGGRLSSKAIGLEGGPTSFAWTTRKHMENFGHSDYWKKVDVVKYIAQSLGMPVDMELAAHQPPALHLPEAHLPVHAFG